MLLNSPQRLYARGLTLIGVLLTIAGWEGQWAMIFLVMEASKSRLLRCKKDTANSSYWQRFALVTR
jgi:hypothetical protein